MLVTTASSTCVPVERGIVWAVCAQTSWVRPLPASAAARTRMMGRMGRTMRIIGGPPGETLEPRDGGRLQGLRGCVRGVDGVKPGSSDAFAQRHQAVAERHVAAAA